MYAIHVFDTTTEHDNKRLNEYNEPWVSYTLQTELVDYNKTEEEKEQDELYAPLTFEILTDGTLWWSNFTADTSYAKTIEYKLNDGEWTSITSANRGSAPGFNVVAGDIVQFRGNNPYYGAYDNGPCSRFSGTCEYNIKGNIMSLINSTDFASLKTLVSNYTFVRLFTGTYVKDASRLKLPATALTEYCYFALFIGCPLLTAVPELPAARLASNCYRGMFGNCPSLTTIPAILPATTLTNYCYAYMFQNCGALTMTPELPATELVGNCYEGMFFGCTNITDAPALPSTTLAQGCYQYMFSGCTSLVVAPELPATTLAEGCYNTMFANCTSLATAPELPATTLASTCYRRMFSGCTNLNYIKCLATNITAADCTIDWARGVASTGTFVKNASMSSWATGYNGIPEGWTTQNAA